MAGKGEGLRPVRALWFGFAFSTIHGDLLRVCTPVDRGRRRAGGARFSVSRGRASISRRRALIEPTYKKTVDVFGREADTDPPRFFADRAPNKNLEEESPCPA